MTLMGFLIIYQNSYSVFALNLILFIMRHKTKLKKNINNNMKKIFILTFLFIYRNFNFLSPT